ncbi:major facilitator superfamily transporter [Colletotrichum graminicola M1.001]|uniref:Major facilitator superfamily transporter n=1 Tax=Colletotrichum graminicola (strain M1.001 / M2 / FGSC 10212) TaxID=645133 RepID=E3QK45_COLGM|nr:major facilitator superfamily transporter [Colletotrichum graminicola M1.001]EFQ31233.1 major facilitator superfamily transporter [Colletotrichum graminicola M1.001]
MDPEKGAANPVHPDAPPASIQDGHETDHSSDDAPHGPVTKAEEQTCDGRDAWITVAASSLTMFVYLGVIYSWGIMQVRLVETAGSSLTTLTFVGSLATSFMICFSIVSDKIVCRVGYRLSALVGGVFMGLGEVLASFATRHVVALFFLHGLVFGLGGGLCVFSVSTAPMSLFKRRKALAMGFVFGGGSLGSAVMSVATNFLVRDLGVAWTFRILGFILWGVSIPASYFLPQRNSSGKKASRQLQWYRFKQPRFLLLVGGTILACFPLFIPPYFIPIFSRSMGYPKEVGIIILAAWNLASTLGRIMAGWVADTLLGPVESLAICMLFMSLSSLVVWPLSSSIGIFAVYLFFNGVGCGAFFSLTPIAVGATFGAENTLSIIPVIWTTWFCGFFFGTPIASGLYSLSGGADGLENFRPAAYYAGAMAMAGFACVLAMRFTRTHEVTARM